MKPNSRKIEVQVPLEVTFEVRESSLEKPSEIIVLLHGYLQTARVMLQLLSPALPAEARVLSVNGPFLVPKLKPEGPEARFSWYFYDPRTDEYLIDMRTAIAALKQLLAPHAGIPVTLIGFSQGGFLAPFAAPALGAKRVIGIGSRFLEDELPPVLPFEIWGIHSEDDTRVPYPASKAALDQLLGRAAGGGWIGLQGQGHRVTPEVLKVLGSILRSTP